MTTAFAIYPARGAAVSLTSLAREMAAAARTTLLPPAFPADARRGSGQPVIVLPGFGAHDVTTARLRKFLGHQGFAPQPWTCGINIGPARNVLAAVEQQVMAAPGPVALVGVSLGGTIAREIARRCPDHVSRVITLASPVRLPVVSPLAPLAIAASILWDDDGREALERIAQPLPVPLTAIVCPNDGIVAWQACIPDAGEGQEVLMIPGAHTTMGSNPDVQRIIAERLAREPGSL